MSEVKRFNARNAVLIERATLDDSLAVSESVQWVLASDYDALAARVAWQRRLIQNAQAVLAQATYVVDGKLGTDIQNVCDELYLHLKGAEDANG